MNANYRRVPTEFGTETGFEVRPASPAPFRRLEENRLERLKKELLGERLEEATEPRFNSYLRRAANEAAALAWVTPYPLLVFPALFEEKAEFALARADRQEDVRERSRELMFV
jgi:hypothetical protein